jgi:fatty acid desaturase
MVRPYVETIRRGLERNDKAPINYRRAFVQQTCTFAIMAWLVATTPAFYAPFYAMVWVFSLRTDYENHVGCDDAELNFANNVIDERYNWIRNNFGYHTAHHLHPEAHWSELPALHAQIADRIPAERFEPIGWSRTLNPLLLGYELKHRLGRSSRPRVRST